MSSLPPEQLPLGVRLRDRAVFASFLAGPNAGLLAQLQALLSEDRVVILLWGARGAGKSHLLQAVCHQQQSTVYLPLRQLLSLGAGSIDGAEEQRCVCIDDLHSVLGDASWERALFRLYTELDARGGKLLLACDAPPAALRFVLPDLASRVLASQILALRVLDETQQRAALQLRAHLRGLELPEESALYLQRRYQRDMHTLYGLLETLDVAALSAQRRLTVPFIRAVLDQVR
ncbi:MAG: DnaA regulatory inactivator Hda [Steroidobacteraceae bacterium]